MKTKKTEYYSDILKLLKELKVLQPTVEIGKHISTILDDYDDIWGVSDKNFHSSLVKYKAQLELFTPHEVEEIEDPFILTEEEEEDY